MQKDGSHLKLKQVGGHAMNQKKGMEIKKVQREGEPELWERQFPHEDSKKG